jgi:hypothetical protein
MGPGLVDECGPLFQAFYVQVEASALARPFAVPSHRGVRLVNGAGPMNLGGASFQFTLLSSATRMFRQGMLAPHFRS